MTTQNTSETASQTLSQIWAAIDDPDFAAAAPAHLAATPPPPPFADIAAILSRPLIPPRPEIGSLADGTCLFYRRTLNELHAEPSVGKTNAALAVIKSELALQHPVLFLDPESNPIAILSRLLSFGVEPDTLIRYFKYSNEITPEAWPLFHRWASENNPSLVVLDGLAETLALEGLDENIPAEVLAFFHSRLTPFYAHAAAAVLVTDHVTKSTESRGRWSRGSGAKIGRYDGAVYSLQLIQPYTRTCPGRVRFTIEKDREGGAGRAKDIKADLLFTPNATHTRTDVEFVAGAEIVQDNHNEKLHNMLTLIKDLLDDDPASVTKTKVAAAFGGNRQATLALFDQLVTEQYIAYVPRTLPGITAKITILKDLPSS